MKKLHPQSVEIIGKNRLIHELILAGLEVSIPARDRGIDLIAYSDLNRKAKCFLSKPIQIKSAWDKSFCIDQKYEKFPDMIIAFIWNVSDFNKAETYALTYKEVIKVANKAGWTKTDSWLKGKYTSTKPGKKLIQLLQPYKMTPDKWWQKVTTQAR